MHAHRWLLFVLVAAFVPGHLLAQDVTRPDAVQGVLAEHDGVDVELSWDPVLLDAAGNGETVDHYNIYRGTTPDFVADKAGGGNLVGSSGTEAFSDPNAIAGPDSYYYRISAVDAAGNESDTVPSRVVGVPVLSGNWTATTIEVNWTDAAPLPDVVGYRVYYGKTSGQYEFVDDVGLLTSHTISGVQTFVNWYVAVTAIDVNGNETPFSNEHVDAINGTVRLRVHDWEEICWDASQCTPADPEKIQRNSGFQILVPTEFPEGDWTSVEVALYLESRLCTPPAQGTITKCGPGNPCPQPPCNGGYNPCGDPWDRIAQLFLVLDDCVTTGGSCISPNNLELIRAITPFGTDARPPDGTGTIRARNLKMDVTPYAPLLTGSKYVGVEIVHFTQSGHWVRVDFTFSERPDLASPKPPADGIEIVGFGNAPLPTKQVSVPAAATDVQMRLFTSGHGGPSRCDGGSNHGQTCGSDPDCPGGSCTSLSCDGGSNDANPCSSSAQCPGGICNPCDEFCHRTNRILVDGVPKWQAEPWRSDCSPGPSCSTWNACGFPSCTFSRAGWCPGYIACHHDAPCDNDLDFDADLPAGGTYNIDYDVVPQNGSWPISLVMYWYE